MKRRDFVKLSLCLGCAGAVGIPVCKRAGLLDLLKSQNKSDINYIYKSENDLPKNIRLDVCNMCQLHCAACWIRKDEEKIKKEAGGLGYLSSDKFKDFVDKHPFIEEIEMSNNGEIFLNPELENILKYAYEKGIGLTAYHGVNLNTLSERMAEALVKYHVRYMVVSIDGATPETYAIYRRGGDFNTVINNIKKINNYKEKYNSKYPELVYKFVLFGHNEHEIEKAKSLAKELNMEMKFDINYAPDYSPLRNPEKVFAQTGINADVYHVSEYLKQYNSKESNWFLCKDLFDSPQINYNGDLFGCSIPYLKTFGVNVFEKGLLNSLNDEKVIYAKKMLSDLSLKPKYDIPCNTCFVYEYLVQNNSPFRYRR